MQIDHDKLAPAHAAARRMLLARRGPDGHWTGELSSSALATATAVVALAATDRAAHAKLIDGGLDWLAHNVNADGGWGDTTVSQSNVSTTLLGWSAFAAAGADERFGQTVRHAETWITRACGSTNPGQIARHIEGSYGQDRTFAVPILAACAISGRLGPGRDAWRHVRQLPFELAAAPHRLLRWLHLPVVSYALPALIAIGQVKHRRRPSANPLARLLRSALGATTLTKLHNIQPASGGFLEAQPLTSFVAMSLAEMGLANHPVARRAVEFLRSTVRPDGSWPIDTNLATWVTTLSVGALAAEGKGTSFLDSDSRGALTGWLLGQQYRTVHPYTGARAGGWAWTDLPGGVPDADDTAGALLALRELTDGDRDATRAARLAAAWLVDLQNADGGTPTFCRGWGRLAFDRSSPDITAHCLLAWQAWLKDMPPRLASRVRLATDKAMSYLRRAQRDDGSWVPLWFGNQDAQGQHNPTYGTARVLQALAELCPDDCFAGDGLARRGVSWLLAAQKADGGWGGDGLAPASIEETALAVDAMTKCFVRLRTGGDPAGADQLAAAISSGADWLIRRTEGGERFDPSPIGLYFARLWYHEQLYPLIFTVSALGRLLRANL